MPGRCFIDRRSALGWLAVAALLGGTGPVGPVAAERRVVVQGRVLTETGEGLAGWPIQLIATQRYIELKRFVSGGDMAIVGRAVSDANGYFSIDVPKGRKYQFWFLRLAEAGRLDTIRYLPPQDIEITASARRARVATVDAVIRQHPDWPEVERRVAQEGGEHTERGRILRTLGLPEKAARNEATGEEEWWYFTRGVLYTFSGTGEAGLRRFEPVKPPPEGTR